MRIGLDLAPDAAHQHVDAALERAGISALGEVEQAVARQHPARPFAEGLQQVELGAGHRDERAGGIAQFPQADVDPPSEKGERGRTLDGAGRARGSLAAQDRLDPGEQFARIERLREIVVGAHFEPDDTIHVFAARGQHDDRRLRRGANLAAQAEAVLARQHHVEDEKIDPALGHCPLHFAAVAGRGHVAGIGAQIFRDQRPRFAIVFDDEDMGGWLGHADLCR